MSVAKPSVANREKPESCAHCGIPTNPDRRYVPPTECRFYEDVHGEPRWLCDPCAHAGAPLLKAEPKVIEFKTEDNHYGSETSAQAASDADESAKLNDTHFRILGRLCWMAQTPDEIAISMQLNWSTARARMTDLKNAGLITPTGERRETAAGKEANVMRPTTPQEREQEQAA